MHMCASDRQDFAVTMLGVFAGVACYAHFRGARLPVPTNLHLYEWARLCSTDDDDLTLS